MQLPQSLLRTGFLGLCITRAPVKVGACCCSAQLGVASVSYSCIPLLPLSPVHLQVSPILELVEITRGHGFRERPLTPPPGRLRNRAGAGVRCPVVSDGVRQTLHAAIHKSQQPCAGAAPTEPRPMKSEDGDTPFVRLLRISWPSHPLLIPFHNRV